MKCFQRLILVIILFSITICSPTISMENWKKEKDNKYIFNKTLNKKSLQNNRWPNALAGLSQLEASHHRIVETEENNNEIHLKIFETEFDTNNSQENKTPLRTLIIKTEESDKETNQDKLLLTGCINSLRELVCREKSADFDTTDSLIRFKVLWWHEVVPSIKFKLAKHIGQELARTILIKWDLDGFEPVNAETLKKIKQFSSELEQQEELTHLLLNIKKYHLAKRTHPNQDDTFLQDYESLLNKNTAGAI